MLNIRVSSRHIGCSLKIFAIKASHIFFLVWPQLRNQIEQEPTEMYFYRFFQHLIDAFHLKCVSNSIAHDDFIVNAIMKSIARTATKLKILSADPQISPSVNIRTPNVLEGMNLSELFELIDVAV